MKLNIKKVFLTVGGLLLSVGNALAEATNTSSSDIVGNLGMFSTMASTIMTYSKYIAFLMAVLSLLALWVSGMLAKISHKVHDYIDSKEGLKNWLVEAVLVIAAFIILFSWVIPTINNYVPSSL